MGNFKLQEIWLRNFKLCNSLYSNKNDTNKYMQTERSPGSPQLKSIFYVSHPNALETGQ
jgi:hypothetical protein